MYLLIRLLLSGLAVYATAYLLPGVNITNFMSALVVAIVLGLLNTFIRPILLVFTLPINVLTLGLFTFVINALIVLMASSLVPGFRVDSIWWAMAFSMVLFVINTFFYMLE